jgi:Pectate lyase superfamily protein
MSGPTGTQKVFDISDSDFGAIANTTDTMVSTQNSAAINGAIQAALNNGGGVVYIPSGVWSFSNTLNLPYSVSIVGDGQSSQLLYQGAVTTLTAPIPLTTASEITVASSAQFPPAPFYVSIGSEILLVTAIGGTNNLTWEVKRGQQGTAAATALGGAAVMPVSAILWMDPPVWMDPTAPNAQSLRFAGQIADLWLTSNNSPSLIGIRLVNVGGAHMNRIIITGEFSTAGVVMAAVPPPNMEFSHLNQCTIHGVPGDGIQLQGETWVCSALECVINANGGWGVNAAGGLPSSFSVYNCDLEGNYKGGITGKFTVSEFEGNYYENADNSIIQSFQALDTDNVLVLVSNGNLYLTAPGASSGSWIDIDVNDFQGLDVNLDNLLVLGTDSKLSLATGPFPTTNPPPSTSIASSVTVKTPSNNPIPPGQKNFQGLNDSQTALVPGVLVLGGDGKLRLAQLTFGTVPLQQISPTTPAGTAITVQAFQGLDNQNVLVLGTDGKLWLVQAPEPLEFGNVSTQQISPTTPAGTAVTVQAFQGLLDNQNVLVLDNNKALWLVQAPEPLAFGNASTQLVDDSVLNFHGFDSQTVLVLELGTDGNLWLEHGPFGTNVPPPRDPVDSNVLTFQGLAKNSVLVLDSNGGLWLESAPFGRANRKPVSPYAPLGGPAIQLGQCTGPISIKGNAIRNWLGPFGMDIGRANGLNIGSGMNGCIVEGNQFSYPNPQWPLQNAGTMVLVQALTPSLGGGPNLRIRNNQILSPWVAGTPTRVQIKTYTSGLDAGLRMSSFRFAAHDLQASIPRHHPLPAPPPRQLAVYVPFAEGVATFPAIAMEEPGYVVAVVARLTHPPSPGTWTVGVQIGPPGADKPITIEDPLGNALLVDIKEQTAEGVIGLLGYDDTQDVDNQFATGWQLGVTVSTSANWPVPPHIEGSPNSLVIDVVVDVIVGFGALGI